MTTVCSSGNGTEQRGRRSGSSGDVGVVDSNVLRKVASLTLDRATIDKKVTKPKFVPEKLDFKIYEKFEGECILCIQTTFVLELIYSTV